MCIVFSFKIEHFLPDLLGTSWIKYIEFYDKQIYQISIENFLIYDVKMKRIEFAIQENMKRIIICDKLKLIRTFPSKLSKNCPGRGF